jgi:hypothetical protein
MVDTAGVNFCPHCGGEVVSYRCVKCGVILPIAKDGNEWLGPRNYENEGLMIVTHEDLTIPSPCEFVRDAKHLYETLVGLQTDSVVNNFRVAQDLMPKIVRCSRWPFYSGGEALRKVDCWELFSGIIGLVLDSVEACRDSAAVDLRDLRDVAKTISQSWTFDWKNMGRAKKFLRDFDEITVQAGKQDMADYQRLYSQCKTKCCKCGGIPVPGIYPLIRMNGTERSKDIHWLVEFDVPVCRECEMKRREMLEKVYRERSVAQTRFEKKKRMMDFVVFGRERVLREAYKPISETYHQEDDLKDRFFSDFPVVRRLLSKGYSFGEFYDTGMRGRGLGSARPENVCRLV